MGARETTVEPTPATNLRSGDSVLHPDLGVFTLTSRPLRLRMAHGKADHQWVTLRMADENGTPMPEIEVHEGDYFDRIVS